MSNGHDKTYEQGNVWRDEEQVFRAVGVIVLIVFGIFVIYDARIFYKEHVTRCRQAPDLPECRYLNLPKPTSPPELGIVLDHGTGKWAIQLSAMDQQTANSNLSRLTNAGATARLIKTTGRKKKVFYNIQLGRFKSQRDATEAGRQLKAKGLVTDFTVAAYRSASQ